MNNRLQWLLDSRFRGNDNGGLLHQQQPPLDFAAGAAASVANGIGVPQPGKMP
jgi:hypothetical protein